MRGRLSMRCSGKELRSAVVAHAFRSVALPRPHPSQKANRPTSRGRRRPVEAYRQSDCSALLVVAAIAQPRRDVVSGCDQVRAERVYQLLQRNHRAVRRDVHGRDNLTRLSAHRR
jgi:hypothetical protein